MAHSARDLRRDCYAAVDIGASSGRVVVGFVEDGRIHLEEVHRFDNRQVRRGGHDCWDIDLLYGELVRGLALCKEAGFAPKSVGIDTWGVDFVLLDADDNLVGDAVEGLSSLAGHGYKSINIVGGGCRDGHLNRRTAEVCGLPVYAGPVEGTALGNLAVQMLADGVFPNLRAVRAAIAESFDVQKVEP